MEHSIFGVLFATMEKQMKMDLKNEIMHMSSWYQLLQLTADSCEMNSYNFTKMKNFLEDLCQSELIPNGMTGIYMICTIKNIYLVRVNQENIIIQIRTWSDLMTLITGIRFTGLTEPKLILSAKLSELLNQASLLKNLLPHIPYLYSKSDLHNSFSNKL